MNKKAILLITVLCITLFCCDEMAVLFHGEKPGQTYTVTFNGNGAIGAVPSMRTVEAGTVIILPDKGGLSKAGSVFAGWSESSNGNGTTLSAGASVAVTKNIIFYAQWLTQYNVTFNANGASGTPPEAQIVNSGAVIILPGKGGLSKGADIFAGWNESSSGGTTYSIGASVTVTRNMVFYAQWIDGSAPQYTVTFNANGATGGAPPASQTVYSGVSITVPNQETLVYSGKIFGGWNTQANGGGTNYAVGAAFTVTGNVTLYAKWQSAVQYTVIYHANGASGNVPPSQTVDPGTEITLPGQGSMNYTGRIFDGWNTQADGSGTRHIEGAIYTVNVNTSFFAQWSVIPVVPQGSTLEEKLAYIKNSPGNGITYDVVVDYNEYIGPQSVTTLGTDITVIIRSTSPADVKRIQLDGTGSLFTFGANITLILRNIELRGINNNRALITVNQNGKLILDSGSRITMNNNKSDSGGGGVYISGGAFEMNDGAEIIGNTSGYYGGGIYVYNGIVTIRGGLISENSSTVPEGSLFSYGGGIYMDGSSSVVTMNGGIISKNTASYRGGGIYINDGRFTKRPVSGSNTSGIIYGSDGNDNANTVSSFGIAAAICYGSRRRELTLYLNDEISTLSDEGWGK